MFFDNETMDQVEKYLENYNDDDIDDVKALWKGAVACKFNRELLDIWNIRVGEDEKLMRFFKLFEMKLKRKFSNADYIYDTDEYNEKKESCHDSEQIKRMDYAREYEDLKFVCEGRIASIDEMVQSFKDHGISKETGNPIWLQKDHNTNYGLASMRPFKKTIQTRNQKIEVECYGFNDKDPQIIIYDNKIFAGKFSIESMQADLNGNRNEEFGLIDLFSLCVSSVWEYGAQAVESAKRKSAILAAQQVAMQKFGSMSVTGGSAYIDDVLDVAAKNGTWKYISSIQCTTGKYKNYKPADFKKKLERTVINQSGVDTIWRKLSSKDLRGDISVVDVEREIRSSVTGILTVLSTLDPDNKVAAEIREKYSDLLNLRRGYLIDKIIETRKNSPGNDFIANVDRLLNELGNDPEMMSRVMQHIEAKAESRNALADIPPDVEITNTSASILAQCLGLNSDSKPEQIVLALKNMANKINEYKKTNGYKTKAQTNKQYGRRVDKLFNNINRIISDPLILKNPNYVLAASESVNYKGKSLSGEITDIVKDMKNASVQGVTAKTVNFADAIGKRPEQMTISQWNKNMIDKNNNVTMNVNGSRYTMNKMGTAAGDILVVKENNSPVPVALIGDGKIVSGYSKTGFSSADLKQLAKGRFNVTAPSDTTKTGMESRQEQRQEQKQEQRSAPDSFSRVETFSRAPVNAPTLRA